LSPFNPFIPEKANAKLENIFPVSKYLWKIFLFPWFPEIFAFKRAVKI
jgi:hypothetical protein